MKSRKWRNMAWLSESFCISFLFVLLLVLFSQAFVFPQEAKQEEPTPSEQSTSESSPSQTPTWDSLDQLLTALEADASVLPEESRALLNQLRESQTEANGLRSSLNLSEQSRQDLEKSTKAEREAAAKMIQDALKKAVGEKKKSEFFKTTTIVGVFTTFISTALAVVFAVF